MQSRNIIMFISLFILKQLYSNVLFCLFCYEVSWLYGYPLSSYSIFIICIMIIVIFKKFSSAKIKTFLATRNLKQIFYSDSNLEYIWAYLSGLLLQLKNLEHLTIQLLWVTVGLLVARFTVQSTQWMKEMRTWGWSRFHLIVFLFGMNQVHCSSLNSRVQGEYLNCIVSAKIAKLWGEYLTIQLYGQQPDCW